MALPVIGITTKRQINAYGFPEIAVAEAYFQAVSKANGLPVLIPLGLSQDQIHEIVSSLDGVIFSGGDVEPQAYGAEPTPKVNGERNM
ncbi:MAG: hypothetical protein FJ010_01455 [Chloroflexi bacterium]|nr:hypothetical protein [Chloroflexota bacterium]